VNLDLRFTITLVKRSPGPFTHKKLEGSPLFLEGPTLIRYLNPFHMETGYPLTLIFSENCAQYLKNSTLFDFKGSF
jgi:hypothetical protein